EHALGDRHATVAGGFLAYQGTAAGQPPASLRAFMALCQPPILAIHIADLACADADITPRHVDIGADMVVQHCHEGLAEAHDFGIRALPGIEIRPTLAAADGQTDESILEDLLEAQELDDTGI